MNYLVKFKPLEPYTFGTDFSFKFQGIENPGKETYFVRSKEIPEQTTILGALRYMILENEGLLKSDFNYSHEDDEKIKACIGENSFSFSAKQKQSFGFIHEISPLFLVGEQGDYLIKNPFHNKSQDGYFPIQMSEDFVETSAGFIKLPNRDEYNSKIGHASGYYNLNTKKVVSDGLFQSMMVPGNRKNEKGESDEDCYFKRERISLNENYSFAVYVNAEKLPKQAICYMGLKKSAFHITAEVKKNNDLKEKVKNTFFTDSSPWYYALSDVFLKEPARYDTFSIVEEKQLRNLETMYREDTQIKKVRKSEIKFNMVEKGSVFFGKCPISLNNENCKQIGYNQVVRLGGN